jgi:hypothetical protein
VQARDNFGYELAALRRSFRYNEYQEMEAPPNFFARVSQYRCNMHVCELCVSAEGVHAVLMFACECVC